MAKADNPVCGPIREDHHALEPTAVTDKRTVLRSAILNVRVAFVQSGIGGTTEYIVTYKDGHEERAPTNADPKLEIEISELAGFGEQDGVFSPGQRVQIATTLSNCGALTIPAAGIVRLDSPTFDTVFDQCQTKSTPAELGPGAEVHFAFEGRIPLDTEHDTMVHTRACFGFPGYCDEWEVKEHAFRVLYAVFAKDIVSKCTVHRGENVIFGISLENYSEMDYGHSHSRAVTLHVDIVSGPACLMVDGVASQSETRQIDTVAKHSVLDQTFQLEVNESVEFEQRKEREIVLRIHLDLNLYGRIFEGGKRVWRICMHQIVEHGAKSNWNGKILRDDGHKFAEERMLVVRHRRAVAETFCWLGGTFGLHRFYTGRWASGLCMAMMVCMIIASVAFTVGGSHIGTFLDPDPGPNWMHTCL